MNNSLSNTFDIIIVFFSPGFGLWTKNTPSFSTGESPIRSKIKKTKAEAR